MRLNRLDALQQATSLVMEDGTRRDRHHSCGIGHTLRSGSALPTEFDRRALEREHLVSP